MRGNFGAQGGRQQPFPVQWNVALDQKEFRRKKTPDGFFSLELITKEKTSLLTLIRLTAVISWFKQRQLANNFQIFLLLLSSTLNHHTGHVWMLRQGSCPSRSLCPSRPRAIPRDPPLSTLFSSLAFSSSPPPSSWRVMARNLSSFVGRLHQPLPEGPHVPFHRR